MLLQSHEILNTEGEYIIDVLPAVPEKWSSGEFSGLCARGGFEVSAKWVNCKPTEIRIRSLNGNCVMLHTDLEKVECDGMSVKYFITGGADRAINFNTEKGKTYILS